MYEGTTYVGVDAHKKDLFIAMLVGDPATPVTWQLANEPQAVRRLIRLARTSVRSVSDDAGHELYRALDAARFWSAAFFEDPGSVDGYVWTIEGRRDGKYRVVTRVNSDRGFQEAARVFVRLSGIDLPREMEQRN